MTPGPVASGRTAPPAHWTVFLHPNVWMLAAVFLFIAMRLYVLLAMIDMPTTGDESYQFRIVREGFDIYRGTFMPGIGYYLSAFYLFLEKITLPDARVIVGVTNIVLMLIATALVRTTMGPWYAVVFLAVLACVPEWNIVSVTLWGEHPGSLMLVINFLSMVWLFDRIVRKQRINILWYPAIAVLFGASLYVRQNFMVFPVIALVLGVIVFIVLYARDGVWRFNVFVVPLVFVVGLAALTPWSMALSSHLGGFRIAPISQELSLAIHYGKPRLMPRVKQVIRERIAAEGEAGGYSERMLKANTFLVVHRAARIQAEAEGRPLLDIYKEYRRHALEGLTARHVVHRVKDAWQRFLFSAGTFAPRFLEDKAWGLETTEIQRVWMRQAHLTIFIGAFALSLVVAIIPFWGSLSQQLMVIAFKGTFCFACLQPFVHRTIARHHQFVVPLMVLGALLLFRECRRIATKSSYSEMAGAEKALFFAQAAGGLMVLAAALLIAFYPL